MSNHKENLTRILIVEDDEDDFILAEDYLSEIQSFHFVLDRAKTADQGIQKLSTNLYDLCLLDYQLGDATGLEVLEKARELDFDSPIIMLTGQSDAELDQSALNKGAADYLVKSELTADHFARSIRYALARREVEVARTDREKAELENESKTKFIAHLSHELRTPLTAILGYAEILLTDPRAKAVNEELAIILRNSRHLLSLLNDVLDLSKIEAGKLELSKEPSLLNSLLADVFTLMQVSARDKGLELELTSISPVPEVIDVDPVRLRQVLINLISNAIKFTDRGTVLTTVGMAEKAGKHYLQLVVKDSGVGIPPEKLEVIFQPFTQVEDVFSKTRGGSGLGLAICAELVRRMGGFINVDSQTGQGSEFSVFIDPGHVDQAKFTELNFSASHSENTVGAISKNLHGDVLVVDDLREIRQLVGHYVEQSGANVVFARDGVEAIQKINVKKADGESFSVVLMDIHMPNMTGTDACQALRNDGYTSPLIALTASSMKGVDEELLETGFDAVLSKPVNTTLLYKLLKRYLSKKALTDKPEDQSITISTKPRLVADNEKKVALVVEDDKDAAKLLATLLESLGYSVTCSHSTQEAIEKVTASSEWTHVLLDLNLGEDSGLELLKFMEDNNIKINTTIISGEQLSNTNVARWNIQKTLLKPITLSQLAKLEN